MKIFSLLQVKYTQFENAVKSYLSKTLSQYNTSYGNNTIFGQLINVLNATVQNIMLYIEDSLVEQNKYTAQRKKSIYGLAAQSGYEPSLGKTASVQLAISYMPTNVSNLNILIKNHEQLTCTQNGLIYNLILPQEAIVMSLEKDNSTRYISAVQGKFEKQTFISIIPISLNSACLILIIFLIISICLFLILSLCFIFRQFGYGIYRSSCKWRNMGKNG